MSLPYALRPKADQDLEDQAFYYASQASVELGHRFLIAAHETLALIASEPEMGWQPKFSHSELRGVRLFRIKEFPKIVILYRVADTRLDVLRVLHGSRNLRSLLETEGLN